MRPIDGPIFVCLQCHFVLHESCAKSPHKIRHPFHPQHSLTLVERFHHSESCNACQSIFNGFIYRCGECKFKLDTKCALLIPNVKFKLHQHPLVFLTAYRCDCVKCGCKDCKQVFRCVDCDFNLHLHCAPTLPLKAKHQCHRHYLTLTKSPVKDLPDENDDSELYCDVCEQLRYLPDPTYYCSECHFVAHIHCMISEEEALALGEESFVVGQLTGDADDAANHGKTVGEDLNKEGMVVKEEEAVVLPASNLVVCSSNSALSTMISSSSSTMAEFTVASSLSVEA
ncbi:hypothetical protein LOK49_LG13G01522 [Camellia lanceoleosa]|uniref:Uncharacterized protein n=1 Tax=Camellia lanceoleosa TaxID=1840588 RepID=A0ACC0FJ08_9ERIC|nr:hypothetical protein LOK49_LG13G01522 [Camellia lanceoleosa]